MSTQTVNGLTFNEFKSALRTYAFFNKVMFWNKRKCELGHLLYDALTWIEVLENEISCR